MNFYRSHAFADLNLESVVDATSAVRITGTVETPNENRSDSFLDDAISARQKTLWIPAADVILHVAGTYRDGAERGLSWHLKLTPGFRLDAKRIRLAVPACGFRGMKIIVPG